MKETKEYFENAKVLPLHHIQIQYRHAVLEVIQNLLNDPISGNDNVVIFTSSIHPRWLLFLMKKNMTAYTMMLGCRILARITQHGRFSYKSFNPGCFYMARHLIYFTQYSQIFPLLLAMFCGIDIKDVPEVLKLDHSILWETLRPREGRKKKDVWPGILVIIFALIESVLSSSSVNVIPTQADLINYSEHDYVDQIKAEQVWIGMRRKIKFKLCLIHIKNFITFSLFFKRRENIYMCVHHAN